MSAALSRQSNSPFASVPSQLKQKALFDAIFPDYVPVSTQPVLPSNKSQNEDQDIFENLIGTLKENLVGDMPYSNPQVSLHEKLQSLHNHPLLRAPTSQRAMLSKSSTETKYSKTKIEILMLVDDRSQTDSDTDSASADSLPFPQSTSLSPKGSRLGRTLHSSQSAGNFPKRPATATLPSLFRPVGAPSLAPVVLGTPCKHIVVSTPVSTRPPRTLPPV